MYHTIENGKYFSDFYFINHSDIDRLNNIVPIKEDVTFCESLGENMTKITNSSDEVMGSTCYFYYTTLSKIDYQNSTRIRDLIVGEYIL